ncbi:MAG: DMT family transporter [Pseudomonadota bacterium]
MRNIRVVRRTISDHPGNMTKQFTPRSALMLLTLAGVWGGSFFFAEIALGEIGPFTLTFLRVLLAVPALGAWLVMRRIPVPLSGPFWVGCLVMGALNNVIPFSLLFWGQNQMESGLAAILNGMTAIFGAVVAGLLLKDEPLTRNKMVGAVVGLAGVMVIMGPGLLGGLDPSDLAQLAILAATISYAFASVWGRVALGGSRVEANAFGMLVCSAALAVPMMLLVEGMPHIALSAGTWGALVGLACFSTAAAYVLYFAILGSAGAANLMLVTLLVPAFAVALGAVFLGERLPPQAYAGFVIIALGLLITDGRLKRR